ncbi:unnamed protein product [Vicia faba]|uniref:Uncharacterized protein n=1 Tax=Vicia faba TaxID=3906 RepID=A0AAV0Z1L6_VICFA|nr:unnamed protein product [Vicia faba]
MKRFFPSLILKYIVGLLLKRDMLRKGGNSLKDHSVVGNTVAQDVKVPFSYLDIFEDLDFIVELEKFLEEKKQGTHKMELALESSSFVAQDFRSELEKKRDDKSNESE